MKTKTKIIIVAIFALIVYILYRRGVFSTKSGLGGDGSNLSTTPDNPDQFKKDIDAFLKEQNIIATKLDLTADEKEKFIQLVRHIYIACNTNEGNWSVNLMKENAVKNGLTLNQQYANAALWAMSPDGWASGTISEERLRELFNGLKNI